MSTFVAAAAVVLSGLLAGNELGTLAVSHPVIEKLPLRDRVAAEQQLTRRLARIMPFAMTVTIVVTVAAAVLLAGGPGLPFALVAAVALILMLIVTLLGNVPLNVRTGRFPPDGTVEEWRAIRGRWEQLHTVRVVLDLVAFGCLVAALYRHAAG